MVGSAKLGLVVAHTHTSISAIAPATGIALAAVLIAGYGMLPAVALGALLAAVTASVPLTAAVGIAAGNTLAVLAAVALLRRVNFRASLRRIRDVVALVGLAGILGSAISATAGIASLALAGALPASQLPSAWRVWGLGEIIGVLVVGAALLMLSAAPRPRLQSREAAEVLASSLALAAVSVLVLGYGEGFAYVILLVVLLLAFVGRQYGAVIGGLVASSIAIWFSARGHGPFAGASADGNLVRAQTFAVVAASTALLVAAARSERRVAERAVRRLAESERALAEAQRLTGIGSYEHEIRTDTTTWSEELYRILGAGPSQLPAGYGSWRQCTHEDDREMVDAILRAAYEKRGSWSFVQRIVQLEGHVRVVDCRGRVEVDEAGEPVRILGTAQDVTGAKLAEDRIRSLFESAPYALLTVDDGGSITVTNSAAQRLFGYRQSELLGGPVERVLRMGSGTTPWYEQLTGADPVTECELHGLRRDGSEFPVEISLSPIHTDDGTLISVAVRDVTERKLAADALVHQASHDPLTGLPNRLLFLDRLEHALGRARRSGSKLAVVFLDLDDFKLVNDTRGHEVGDLLLLALAPRLNAALRPGDTIARFGGDEFVVLCEDLADEGAAIRIARRMSEACSRPVVIGGYEHLVTVSAGVAMIDDGQFATASDLLRDADAAMYRAKAGGKGNIEMFDDGMRARLIERLAIESALRWALERDELRLFYQPIISLRDSRIVGAEALLRWQHPERGLLEPSDFMAAAESSGLIVPIGDWVLQQACRQAAYWNHGAPHPIYVSVNLSPRQVVRAEVVASVARSLRSSGLDPKRLELEITESTLLEDGEACADTLRDLKAIGVRIVLDDFGTGYSSLSYLKRLTIDALKIDRSFVGGLGRDAEDGAIVSAVLSMASALEVGVTAEGVETLPQLARLRAQGCEFGQGFLFSRPGTAEAIGELLSESRDVEGVAV